MLNCTFQSCTLDIVRDGFSRAGLPPTDTRPFQSHMTVAKINRGDRHAPPSGIPQHAYAQFMDHELGGQELKGLELLKMSGGPRDYPCYSKTTFSKQ